jgi:uncharacterized protein (DUF433 family)
MRLRVKDVLDMLAEGASEQEILQDYPDLEPEDIRASLAFTFSAPNLGSKLQDCSSQFGPNS